MYPSSYFDILVQLPVKKKKKYDYNMIVRFEKAVAILYSKLVIHETLC
jgi:hypothetical protein